MSGTSATATDTGRSRGRAFAAYRRSTAARLKGSAARPYTVSVGWTTSRPVCGRPVSVEPEAPGPREAGDHRLRERGRLVRAREVLEGNERGLRDFDPVGARLAGDVRHPEEQGCVVY